jgi:peptidoglycan hydrolase-like protein with peptidoglycan-binding domain
MTPKQVRFVALTSLGAIVAVAVNALLLHGKTNEAQRPAAKTALAPKRDMPKSDPLVVTRGAFNPTTAAIDTIPRAPEAEGDATIVRAVKQALNARGYGPLALEPTTGMFTRAAILAFEFDHGLPLAGEATEALLARMAAVTAPAVGPRVNVKAATPAAEAMIRHVQHKLASLGYLEGKVDGRLGEPTQLALKRFEADQQIVPRGRISLDVLMRLEQSKPRA